MTEKHVGFAPIGDKGKYLFSVCESWGSVEFGNGRWDISVLGNALTLNSISVPNSEEITSVTVDGKSVDFKLINGRIAIDNVCIRKELSLK